MLQKDISVCCFYDIFKQQTSLLFVDYIQMQSKVSDVGRGEAQGLRLELYYSLLFLKHQRRTEADIAERPV